MKKKTVKIKFVDFWGHWNQENNFLINCLKKKYDVEISDNPDYIFFSNFNSKFDHMKYNHCVKIFYTQENLCPDFNYADYAIGFDNIQFEDRYLKYPIYYIPERYQEKWELMTEKHKNITNKLYEREFCSFVVSNRDADPMRENFFRLLCQYKKVDSGGRYLNNLEHSKGVKDKLEFEKKHKFSLCFENSSHPGYVTEKIIEAFAAKTIPIYWGDPDIEKIFNPNSFINLNHFSSLEEAVDKIKELDNNKQKYLDYLKEPALMIEDNWKEKQKDLEEFLYHIFDQPLEQAKRRNMVFWGEEYHRRYLEMKKAYMVLYPFFYAKYKWNRVKKRIVKIRSK